MRTIFILASILCFSSSIAQLSVSDLVEVADAQEYSDKRPRIALVNGVPTVFWMQSNGRLWLNEQTSDSTFSNPINLNAADHDVFVSDYGGSDIAVSGSTMYLTYMTLPFLEAKVYLKKSIDGGANWTDPALIALPDSVIPFLPTVAIDDLGNPVLMIMAYDQDYHHPEWVTLKSTDGGTTFQPMVVASEAAPGEVCDCCPAHLDVQSDQVVALFRNNDNNIRDTWMATSLDGGTSYDTVQDIDPANWNIAGCPSTGPDAVVKGNTVHATWMSAGTGTARIYYSNLNTATHSFETDVIYESGTSQNFPRIAGNEDTLGLVFQNSEDGFFNCIFLYSTNGGVSWSDPIDLYGDSISIQKSPDVAFKDGTFHVVFTDLFSKTIWYRKLSFHAPASITAIPSPRLRLFPNPAQDALHLDPPPTFGTPFRAANAMGQIILQGNYHGAIDLQTLPPGLYFLEVNGVSRRFVISD